MHKTTIVVRNKDHKLADGFKKALLEAHPTGFGTVEFNSKGKLEVSWTSGEKYELAPALDEIDGGNPGRIIYQFVNSDTKLDDMTAPPYTIVIDKGEIKIAVLTDGEFVGFNKADSNLANDYNMISEFLDGEIKEAYNDVQGDLTKTMEIIDGPKFRRRMLPVLQPRGCVLVVCSDLNIPVKSLQHDNSEQIDYSFGWSSRNLGWAETPPKVEAPTGPTREERLAAMRKKTSVPAVTPTPEPTPPKPEEKKEEVAKPVEQEMKVAVPGNLVDRPRSRWFKKNFKKDWFNTLSKNFADLNAIKEVPAQFLRPDSALQPAVKDVTQVRAALAKGVSDAVIHTGSDDVPPVIMATQKATVLDLIRNSSFVDPTHLNDLEDKHDLASEQLGLANGVRDLIRLDPKLLRKICREHSHTAYCMLIELAIELVNADPSLLEPAKEEEEKEEAKEATAEVKAMPTREERLAAMKKKQAS